MDVVRKYCVVCETELYENGRFCSHDCRIAYNNSTKFIKQCDNPQCNNSFTTYNKRIRKYCEKKCMDQAKTKQPSVICAWCSKPFSIPPSQLNVREEPCCSRSCKGFFKSTIKNNIKQIKEKSLVSHLIRTYHISLH